MSDDLLLSPLDGVHRGLGARMVPFAGWSMPVQYVGIRQEHAAVRSGVGIFDISHMGQFFVEGGGGAAWLDGLLTNHVSKLAPGTGHYTFLLNEQGGVIDDLILYRTGEESWFLVVNAAKREEDLAWMRRHLPAGIELRDESADWAGLAVQGPEVAALYHRVVPDGPDLPARNGVVTAGKGDDRVILCRTGYTGEDGFEFFCPSGQGAAWWNRFTGGGAMPCGLGARDTLRLEVCYPLNGSDLDPRHTPIEAGLKFAVKVNKGDFIGREVVAAQADDGPPRRLAAIRMTGKGPPPRPHYPVLHAGEKVGELSSGTLSPSLGVGIGMAYLPADKARIGTALEVEIRGKTFPAEVVKKPFYKKEG